MSHRLDNITTGLYKYSYSRENSPIDTLAIGGDKSWIRRIAKYGYYVVGSLLVYQDRNATDVLIRHIITEDSSVVLGKFNANMLGVSNDYRQLFLCNNRYSLSTTYPSKCRIYDFNRKAFIDSFETMGSIGEIKRANEASPIYMIISGDDVTLQERATPHSGLRTLAKTDYPVRVQKFYLYTDSIIYSIINDSLLEEYYISIPLE